MSDASSVSGDSSATSVSSLQRNYGRKTKFERDIEAAVRKGTSECKNLLHWEVTRETDPTGGDAWTNAGIKPYRVILQLMSPGKAKCSCEKRACRWAWTGNWNYKGMFQTEYVPKGVEQKGIGEVKAGFSAKKIFPLSYGLTAAEFAFLNARFLEWYFVCDPVASHDHPVAHTSTKIVTKRVIDGVVRDFQRKRAIDPEYTELWIDLNGNPTSNEWTMSLNPGLVIMTFVLLITPKDYVRCATKWGPEYATDGTRRYYTTHIRDIPRDYAELGPTVKGFLSFHTTYYYDSAEIINILEWARNATYHAIMHRFDGSHGTLNMGEQNWVKAPLGSQVLVTQTNVKSGETYQHPDNSKWYKYDSTCQGEHGIAWTTNLACDESFHTTATYCPAIACRMSTACEQIAPLMPVKAHSTASAMTDASIHQLGYVEIAVSGAKAVMPIQANLVPFFAEMRISALNKSRNAKVYADHVSKCKRRAVEQHKVFSVDAQQLSDIARFSFFIDFTDQYGSDKEMFSSHYSTTILADPLYKHGAGMITTGTLSVLTDMILAAADAKNVQMGLLKATRAGVSHLNRHKLLQSL